MFYSIAHGHEAECCQVSKQTLQSLIPFPSKFRHSMTYSLQSATHNCTHQSFKAEPNQRSSVDRNETENDHTAVFTEFLILLVKKLAFGSYNNNDNGHFYGA